QAGGSCTVALASNSTNLAAQGTTGAVSFTTSASTCSWTAYSSTPWIQLNSSAVSGQGSGTVPFLVAANPGSLPRTGQITIGDKTYSVTQAAGPTVSGINYTQAIFAGTSFGFGGDQGPAVTAQLASPYGLTFDT